MIVQIRGTSGSGKSTVMKEVMGLMGDWGPEHIKGRKQPYYYKSMSDWPLTFVLGHYETACGGCDSIGSSATVAKMIETLSAKKPTHIICEGLLLSEDVKWTSQMADVCCVFLTTPTDRCVAQVSSRRIEAGNTKPLNEANTRKRVAVIERGRKRLVDLGVRCVRVGPSLAARVITDILRRGS